MSASVTSHSASTPVATPFERVLLADVPRAKHAELLPLLRSPDRTVREIALLLIQLDREEAARRPRPRRLAIGWSQS